MLGYVFFLRYRSAAISIPRKLAKKLLATHDKEVRPLGVAFLPTKATSKAGRPQVVFFFKYLFVCCLEVGQTEPPPALAFS